MQGQGEAQEAHELSALLSPSHAPETVTSLKIVDIVLPKVKLQMLKGFGLGLNIYAKVALHGNSVLGGLLNLVVEVNITAKARLVQNEFGAPVLVVENCKTNLGGIQILSGFLPLNLDRVLTNLLNDVIPGVLCPVVDLVLNVVNILLGTVNSVCPFGTLGKLHYTLAGLPWFNDQHIVLNLNLALIDHEGKTVPFNGTLPALPPAKDQASQMLLSGDILSSMLRMLVTKGAFNLDITEQTLPGGAVPLTTSALQSLLPTISQLVPTPLPLVIRIRVLEVPLLSLRDGQATVTLTATIQVLARTPSGLQNLLGLEAKIVLSGRVIVTATKLGITLSLQSVGLKVTSPGIGFSDIAGLTNWITDILRIGYLPWINGALDVGIPFPNLFNLNFADAAVTTMQDALVVGWTPKKL
ncbi:BPI fold-containing family B member 3 [Hemicordylus capensis]|uniref:BPI fold-containing family B member 3 n=1 Tax=Hemicordylus capensis TaxID=884348 RepID=UPI00230248FF|nr:BPI fold-containing family B member 3 [Hemicordylus capensis]